MSHPDLVASYAGVGRRLAIMLIEHGVYISTPFLTDEEIAAHRPTPPAWDGQERRRGERRGPEHWRGSLRVPPTQ